MNDWLTLAQRARLGTRRRVGAGFLGALSRSVAGSSELSVSVLLALGGVACVGVVLPSLVGSARMMGDVFRGQVSVLAGQSAPGSNGEPREGAWSVAVGANGVSASGPAGSFAAGPNGMSGSSRGTTGSGTPRQSLYNGGPSVRR